MMHAESDVKIIISLTSFVVVLFIQQKHSFKPFFKQRGHQIGIIFFHIWDKKVMKIRLDRSHESSHVNHLLADDSYGIYQA